VIESTAQEPITVSTDGGAGPYIVVPPGQLDAVTAVLRDNGVSFRVDADVISINGESEIAFVNLGRGASAAQVQQLLNDVD